MVPVKVCSALLLFIVIQMSRPVKGQDEPSILTSGNLFGLLKNYERGFDKGRYRSIANTHTHTHTHTYLSLIHI